MSTIQNVYKPHASVTLRYPSVLSLGILCKATSHAIRNDTNQMVVDPNSRINVIEISTRLSVTICSSFTFIIAVVNEKYIVVTYSLH